MIKEEFSFSDMKDYLYDEINLLIAGYPKTEERSRFFYETWSKKGKDILLIKMDDNEKVTYKLIVNKEAGPERCLDLCIGIPKLLQHIGVSEKNVLMDISSLSNVLIMFLTKQLLTKVMPKLFFASYIRPEKYIPESGNIGFELSQQIGAVEAVPGFAKRESANQTLCAFIGFEGVRLKRILETVHSFDKLIPIVAFPSGAPQWFNVTMWNSMDILQSEGKNLSVRKCYSESIFEAVDVLEKSISQDETVVLAPLGTRPHSMACAIFACLHDATRIIYDFVIENERRAIGISEITVYHLSSFIKL